MTYNIQQAAVLFGRYRTALFECFPAAETAAKKVAAEVVDCATADVDQIWNVLWDKPIRAWRNTAVGETMVALARPHMVDGWKKCGLFGDFSIDLVHPRFRASSSLYDPLNYRNTGRVVDILSRLPDANITYYVTWKIVKAGDFLRRRAPHYSAPFDFLATMNRETAVARLMKEFGKGWGPVTCLHFLTDLGMAYKPDQHLARTVAALDLVVCKGDEPNEQEALDINDVLDQVLPLVYPEVSPSNRRHFDKTLMEISRCRLLPSHMYKEAAKPLWDGGSATVLLWDLRGGLPLK